MLGAALHADGGRGLGKNLVEPLPGLTLGGGQQGRGFAGAFLNAGFELLELLELWRAAWLSRRRRS